MLYLQDTLGKYKDYVSSNLYASYLYKLYAMSWFFSLRIFFRYICSVPDRVLYAGGQHAFPRIILMGICPSGFL